jgi:peptidoglycan/xylan/chitin deacetylase (PgdA/CDA1 family)
MPTQHALSLRPAREFVILLYHRIVLAEPYGEAAKTTCSARVLASHLAALLGSGYTPVNLDHACDWLKSRTGLPKKPVVITLDDGYRNNCDVALPILCRFGVTAGVFVTTGVVGRKSTWTTVSRPMLSWSQMREMASTGFWFGAHTVNHIRLTQLRSDAARREIVDSRRVLEQRLSLPIRHFAYPYGDNDERIQEIIRMEGFLTGLSATEGCNRAGTDPYALFRVPVFGTATAANLMRKLATISNESSHHK